MAGGYLLHMYMSKGKTILHLKELIFFQSCQMGLLGMILSYLVVPKGNKTWLL